MPCFNAEAFIEEAVRSALGQSYRNIELIVVDDGSTDRSSEILSRLAEEFGGRLTVLSQGNRGPYPARNFGLSRARGDCIAFLDADDYWDPDFLVKLNRAVVENGADVAYCGWQNVGDASIDGKPYVPPAYELDDPVRDFLCACPWPIHAALVRKEIVQALSGFSERRFSAMDYDFWVRLLTVTRSIVRVPEVLAFYRWHGRGQISAVKWKQTIDAWNVRRDFVRKHRHLVGHLDRKTVNELVNGSLLTKAYTAYWRRELTTSFRLFRYVFVFGSWRPKDLKYILPALFPQRLYRLLVNAVDMRRGLP